MKLILLLLLLPCCVKAQQRMWTMPPTYLDTSFNLRVDTFKASRFMDIIEPGNEEDSHLNAWRPFEIYWLFRGQQNAYIEHLARGSKVNDTLPITSRSSNPSGTVWLTTTDPRITLQYVGTEPTEQWFALASKGDSIVAYMPVNYKPKRQSGKKQQQLILCGIFTKMEPYKQ